ncbi:hypothetical protein BG011_005242 [Mortierella polycephala]|uniref:DUF143-domain-containing protein n=1 Tax=Mortierella polycephala TaxID=41804 RepID=A0A9P6QF54_9FUNG|nr:hypothetical protein BG011_005242 [Mortierella polycephala]
MFSASIKGVTRRVCGQYSRIISQRPLPQRHQQHPTPLHVVLNPRTTRVCYSTTPALFRKYEDHKGHINISKPSEAISNKDQLDQDNTKDHKRLLTNSDDLMVGNEGLETIDPKDFPELYPGQEDIEGLSQESHPDNERDFEGLDGSTEEESSKSRSVLLTDKERSEEEFSWFVDESYGDSITDDQGASGTADFVPLWQKNVQRAPGDSTKEGQDEGHDQTLTYSPDSVAGLVELLESERARNVKVIDMRDKCDWTNWMVIAEGLSERHLGNVADQVYSALKKNSPKSSPPVIEGRDTSEWIVIDAGSVVIHFMTHEARKERDLEGLWASVKNPLKLKDAEDLSWEDIKGKMTKSWKENSGRSRGEDGKRGRRGETDIPLSEVVKW